MSRHLLPNSSLKLYLPRRGGVRSAIDHAGHRAPCRTLNPQVWCHGSDKWAVPQLSNAGFQQSLLQSQIQPSFMATRTQPFLNILFAECGMFWCTFFINFKYFRINVLVYGAMFCFVALYFSLLFSSLSIQVSKYL